jgi:hypothetical protein
LNYPDKPSEIRRAQQDFVVFVSYKHSIFFIKDFGLNLKVHYSRLVEEVRSLSFALDLGFLRSLCIFGKSVNIGLSAKNLSIKAKYSGGLASGEVYEWLPITVVCGCSTALDFKKVQLAPMVDFAFNVIEVNPNIQVGTELSYQNLSLRAGYNSNNSSISFGFGVKLAKYKLDYAANITSPGLTHYLVLTFGL